MRIEHSRCRSSVQVSFSSQLIVNRSGDVISCQLRFGQAYGAALSSRSWSPRSTAHSLGKHGGRTLADELGKFVANETVLSHLDLQTHGLSVSGALPIVGSPSWILGVLIGITVLAAISASETNWSDFPQAELYEGGL